MTTNFQSILLYKEHSNSSSKKSFGNILLAVGAGHMEKNLSIFKLFKDIFLGHLAYILGFRYLKAK